MGRAQSEQSSQPEPGGCHGGKPDDAGEHEAPLTFEVGQEGRSSSQADGVTEQHDAEALDHAQVLAETWVEGTHDEPHEEGTSSTESQWAELDLAQQGTRSQDDEDRQQLMRGEKVGQYCHETPDVVPAFPPRRRDASSQQSREVRGSILGL